MYAFKKLNNSTTKRQGWELPHSLIAHLLITHSLILLKSNERLCAILSERSRQMSDCERITQVTQEKGATVSDSLRSLMINEHERFYQKNLAKKSKIFEFSFFVCFI